ncbi:glycosyltransferase, partial [Bacillus sp. SIMBA_006]
HACGTPVVAFANTGVADIVSHRKTGWLARPNDAEDLAAGIRWALSDETVMKMLSLNARKSAVEKFSYSVVANQYKSLYEKILAK